MKEEELSLSPLFFPSSFHLHLALTRSTAARKIGRGVEKGGEKLWGRKEKERKWRNESPLRPK